MRKFIWIVFWVKFFISSQIPHQHEQHFCQFEICNICTYVWGWQGLASFQLYRVQYFNFESVKRKFVALPLIPSQTIVSASYQPWPWYQIIHTLANTPIIIIPILHYNLSYFTLDYIYWICAFQWQTIGHNKRFS